MGDPASAAQQSVDLAANAAEQCRGRLDSAHAFPGRRLASDIWVDGDLGASRTVSISKPAYQTLLDETGDECGTTLVAGRSIATPFVGAFAGLVMARLSTSTGLREDSWNFDVNVL